MPTWPTVTAELGFGIDPAGTDFVLGDPVLGELGGIGELGATGALFTDVTAYLLEASFFRGRRRLSDSFQPATATWKLKNTDGRFDPANLAGPYVQAGASRVAPEIRARVKATLSAVTYPLSDVLVDRFTPEFDIPFAPITKMEGSDAFKKFAAFDPPEQAATGAGETSGARVNRILDNMSWPSADRDVDTGDVTVQATTLAQPGLTELRLAADTEAGELRMSPDNKVVFRDRDARFEDTRSQTPQGTFGRNAGEVAFSAIEPRHDADLVENLIYITRVGGTEQVVADSGSHSEFGPRIHRRTDLMMETDAAALLHAQRRLHFRKGADIRFDWIEIDPVVSDLALAQMLARDISDRITVNHRPRGVASTIARDHFIEGIEIKLKAPHSWSCRFYLSDATTHNFLVFDHATLGKFDTGAFAFS